jgi:hypothetical protein
MLFLCVNGGSWSVKALIFPRASLITDALIPPDIQLKKTISPRATSAIPSYMETSEYLIGSVAVGIVFLESNGTIDHSTEDWTSAEESKVISEIQTGLSWWANQNPSAWVSFKYDIHYRVPTKYEPINRPSTDEDLWIKESMMYLGYSDLDYFTQVRDYISALRKALNTNWAFSIFVVDSSNDTNGEFAYAYLGGPFLVMTYKNDQWGIDNMDRVTAHEMGHIFYATDEYDGVTEYSGYLNVADVDYSGGLMDKDNNWYLSSGTRGQVGWRDSDGDGILDIVDTFPNTALFAYSPDPTNKINLTYTGLVTEVPYPNNNPKPWDTHRDVTINTIANVQYRVDSGAWLSATATDGAFDASEEYFTFTTLPLSTGTHSIETRGINSVSNAETSFATDTVTVETVPPSTSLSYSSPNYVRTDSIICISKNTYITLNASDYETGVVSTQYRLDSGTWTQYTTPFTLSGIPDGLHALDFYSADEAGNEETIKSFSFIMDNTAPMISLISPNNNSALAESSTNVSWVGLDDGSDIASFEIRIDAENYINVGLSTSHTFQDLVEGNHEVYIKSVDNLGNANEILVNFSVDESPPTISITSPTPSTFLNVMNVMAVWIGSDAVSGIEYYEVKLDDGSWLNVGIETTYVIPGIVEGTHNLTAKAVDKAGNFKETSVTFIVDTTSPVISMLSLQNGSQIRSPTIMVNWISSDETSGIDHYRVRLDGNSWVNLETTNTYTFNGVGDGNHIIDIEATDKAGNSKQSRIDLVVNTSLIGGPGWTDDIITFGTISVCILIALGWFFIKRRKSKYAK